MSVLFLSETAGFCVNASLYSYGEYDTSITCISTRTCPTWVNKWKLDPGIYVKHALAGDKSVGMTFVESGSDYIKSERWENSHA